MESSSTGLYTPATEHRCGMSAPVAKSVGLEAILWLAKVQSKRTIYLRGLHARATRLPAEWWMQRAHWPIETIIGAVEQATPVGRPELK